MTTYKTTEAGPVSAPPPAPHRRNPIMMRLAKVVVGAIVVVLAGLGVASIAGFNPLGMFLSVFQTNQIDRSQPTLLKSIQNLS
jgi:hypothetical protein